MANIFPAQQKRYLDPYESYSSRFVNQHFGAIYPEGKGIISGLIPEIQNTNTIKISKGKLIKDYVLIDFPEDIVVPKGQTSVSTLSSINAYIIVSYQYIESYPPPVSYIDIIVISSFDPTKHVRLGNVTIDSSGQFTSINLDYHNNRDVGVLADGLYSISKNASDYPTTDEQFILGRPDYKWLNIHSKTFTGNLAGVADIATKLQLPNGTVIEPMGILLNSKHNIPTSGYTYDLGSVDKPWAKLYCSEIFTDKINAAHIIGDIQNAKSLDGYPSDMYIRKNNSSNPSVTSTYSLGSENYKWKDIYADTFNGSTFNGGEFKGLCTSSQAADLAEKYTVKGDVAIGDVISISEDPSVDGELCNSINNISIIGIVSECPGLRMNCDSNGIYIAVKGRVKCKVQGPVKKGEPLISYINGMAIGLYNLEKIKSYLYEYNAYPHIIAKTLQKIDSNEIKLIEVTI